MRGPGTVWLFDLDDTLHDASYASMPGIHQAMGAYIQQHLGLTHEQSNALRRRYWHRYGATLLGLIRHHGVAALIATHNMELARRMDRVLRLQDGQLIELSPQLLS